MMRTHKFFTQQSRGASLVVTLLVITILTVIVIAFLQSMQIERATSRSYAVIYSAELAADAGVNAAMDLIKQTPIVRNHYLVGNKTSPAAATTAALPLIGGSTLVRSGDLLPLVSGDKSTFFTQRSATPLTAAAIDTFLNQIRDNPDAVDFNSLQTGPTNWIDPINPALRYPAEWETVQDLDGNEVGRFAFFVVDEQGKLNLERHRGNATDDRNERNATGLALPEINILDGYTMDGSDIVVAGPDPAALSSPQLLTTDEFDELEAITPSLETGLASFTEVADPSRSASLRALFTYLSDTEPDIVPAGYMNAANNFVSYGTGVNAAAGRAKVNINEMATNTDFGNTPANRATRIAQTINSSLAQFRGRDVAFGTSGSVRYLSRLAASIVDYIDDDQLTTTTQVTPTVQEPAGQELQGIVSTVIEKFVYTGASAASANFRHELFVELWNPYTTPVSGDFGMTITSRRPIEGIPGAIDRPLPPLTGEVTVTIQPNERRVYKIAEEDVSVNRTNPTAPTPSMGGTSSNDNAALHSTFVSTWNGQIANWTPNDNPEFPNAGPGLQKLATGTMTATQFYWSANLPQHNLLDRGYRSVADPRQSYSMMYVWLSRNPATNNDFRLNGIGTAGITGNGIGQNISAMWIGRDHIPRSPNAGVPFQQDPEAAARPYNPDVDAAFAPGYIRGGPMRSITELGNIYDPAGVTERGLSGQGGQPSPGSYFINGGGRTLRVGQPERSFFNQTLSTSDRKSQDWSTPGRNAHHLLDFFTVAEDDPAAALPTVPLRININTARRETLASIFLGVGSKLDPIHNSSVINLDGALEIADEIIANRPYNNFADFEKFLKPLVNPVNFDPTLGPTTFTYPAHFNPNDFTNNETDPNDVLTAKVIDRAREEVFRRTFDTMGITSRYLRVFVIGQALQPQSGKVIGQQIQEVLVRLSVEEDPADTYTLTTAIVQRRTP